MGRAGDPGGHIPLAACDATRMNSLTPVVQFLAFGLAAWLGLYLLARDPLNPTLRWSGVGLLAYALALAAQILAAAARDLELARGLSAVHQALIPLPAVFWTGAMITILPQEGLLRHRLKWIWGAGLLPLTVMLLLLNAAQQPPAPAWSAMALNGLVLLPLAAVLMLVVLYARIRGTGGMVGLLLAAAVFFSIGTGLSIAPAFGISPVWVTLAVGLDLVLLGFAISALDAFDQGEALLPHFLRDLLGAGSAALVFGLAVGLLSAPEPGQVLRARMLALTTIALAILWQTLSDPLDALLDRIVFAATPTVRAERAELRGVAGAVPRVPATLETESWEPGEFAQLTRKALSHLGNPPRLARSPLTRLPVVEARLAARGERINTLTRTAMLKRILIEAIEHLKPAGNERFGTTDAWRHYNALHYPYVRGVRPYRRRTYGSDLDPDARKALDWFRSQVPERTLYNWQKDAAALVAQHLREISA